MDTNLARTFIEITSTGSFIGAAKRMNLTQSTVSARIRKLEEQLGRRLFVRNRSGASLTSAGEQFHRYAVSLTQVWEQACQHVAVPSGFTSVLSFGGQASLWDSLLVDWLEWMGENCANISIRAEYGQPGRLIVRLVEGMLDVGVMYTPESRPGLTVKRLFTENLVLVSATTRSKKRGDGDYIFTDWGPEFRKWHRLNFPEQLTPRLNLALGTYGVRYLLNNGGSGYFPSLAVSRYIATGQLEISKKAPVFHLPVYVVYATDHDEHLLGSVLRGLREIISKVA